MIYRMIIFIDIVINNTLYIVIVVLIKHYNAIL